MESVCRLRSLSILASLRKQGRRLAVSRAHAWEVAFAVSAPASKGGTQARR